ncbi:thiamine-phosphate kinase [Fontimonas sp. SYSU GA230001]|uniref:thiamine-phosphate kinase n=1 Tax=Fontimonas sp. SYSU GA230001 TaxID=3142450 RepID=UPI0032B3D898
MDEFALIRRYFGELTAARRGVVRGVGDDAALLAPAAGRHLVVTCDTLIAGRHFPLDTAPYDIGWKSLAVNLSDLAAMGAVPRWFLLALSLPSADESWLAQFCDGLKVLADRHGIALVGGDTTRGDLSITITAMGEVPVGQALPRDGARVGDAVCVTGTLGDAAAGLAALQDGVRDTPLLSRLNRPEPRVAAGLALHGLAHAAIDLSDGLAGDLQHILDASGVGAVVQVDALPVSGALRRRFPDRESRLPLQLCGGDDYELCLCVPPDRLAAARTVLDVPLTVIGEITAERGLRFVDGAGITVSVQRTAYRHFS